jgi:uncharacterized peroxidase-related enzyme
VAHHAAGLRRLLPDERKALVEAVRRADHSGLTAREAAIAAYVEKLTREPSAVESPDVDGLRAAGLEDRAVHDVAHVAAYYAYVNRVALGLGAELEDPGALGQWPQR